MCVKNNLYQCNVKTKVGKCKIAKDRVTNVDRTAGCVSQVMRNKHSRRDAGPEPVRLLLCHY